MTRPARLQALLLGAALTLGCSPGSTPEAADWPEAFGYLPEEVHEISVGRYGYPYVRGVIDGDTVELAFDTGNMAGLSLSTATFDALGIEATGSVTRRNSAGERIGSFRSGVARRVEALGFELRDVEVKELDGPVLAGLWAPQMLDGGRFTLDYGAGRMAISRRPGPSAAAGYRAWPLVRSGRYPALVLVMGTIEGRELLIEVDTGKSRTVVNPTLAQELGLERVEGGFRILDLRIGDLSFEVPSAKAVDQSGIDRSLDPQILAGIGSDVLAGFVWTVDYDAGVMWLPEPGEHR